VISVLWSEPAGQAPSASRNSAFASTRFEGQDAFTEIRRFIVVKEFSHHSMCIPISTYGEHGTLRRHDASHHSIVYTSQVAPEPLNGEQLDKHAIQIIPRDNQTLRPRSRVNFSKTYTVEHNVRVKEIGKVGDNDLAWVLLYWKQAMGFD